MLYSLRQKIIHQNHDKICPNISSHYNNHKQLSRSRHYQSDGFSCYKGHFITITVPNNVDQPPSDNQRSTAPSDNQRRPAPSDRMETVLTSSNNLPTWYFSCHQRTHEVNCGDDRLIVCLINFYFPDKSTDSNTSYRIIENDYRFC